MTDTELLASALRSILTTEGEYVEVPDEGENITLDGTWNLSADEMVAIRRVWQRPLLEPTAFIPVGATVYVVLAPAPAVGRWFLDLDDAMTYQREVGGDILMTDQHSSVA